MKWPRQRATGELDSPKVRLANVRFLNSVPYSLSRDLDWIDYLEVSPQEASSLLYEQECDIACIPVSEFIRHGGYKKLDYGISANGVVESVLLVSEVPLEKVRRVFVDSSSSSSVCLLRTLLSKRPQSSGIRFYRMEASDLARKVKSEDAGLLIGDEARCQAGNFPFVYDLGQMWWELTGLPFVFAVWAYRDGRLSEAQLRELESVFARGVGDREALASAWATSHGQDIAGAVGYVRDAIHYEVSEGQEKAIQTFSARGAEAGLFPRRDSGSHSQSLSSILERASAGERLSLVEGLKLAKEASLGELTMAADERREMLHGSEDVSYIVDRNINYTNVCNVYCRFCAFYRAPNKDGGYVLSKDELAAKVQETVDAGGKQILLQGGLHPELKIDYYEDLFSWLKERFPEVNLHALSADEIWHIARVSSLSLEETLRRLISVGLGSLPGAGGEILTDRVRYRIARLKTTSREWLDVHRRAHFLGITSTCTMMFGVEEDWEDRLIHILRLRELQDETRGFTAFIAWPFQSDNTKLKPSDTSALEYLRVQAVSRLFFDNIPSIQSSWVTQGPDIGQLALFCGANDFGSTMFEENVVSAAGTVFCMDEDSICRHISEAGFQPWRRDVHYQRV